MDVLIPLNAALYGWAVVESVRRVGKDNPRRWMRIAGAIIAGYPMVVYGLAIFGVIPDSEIRLYMRWFQLTISAYVIVEARNG